MHIMDGKESLNYFMKFSRMTLQLLGVWPDPDKNKYLATFHFFAMAVYLFSFVILAQTIQLIIIWGDLDAMSEILACALLLILVAMAKMTCLWCYRKRMIKLLAFIIQDWNNAKSHEEQNIMLEYNQFSKKISQIYILMAFTTSVARFFQISYINADVWFTNYSNATRILTVAAYFPFDWNYSPVFEITYMLDYTAALLGNLCNAGTDSLFSQIGFHYAAQFRILHLNIINIAIDGSSKHFKVNFKKRLCYIVQKHEHINRCLGMLEDTFCFMLLVQLLSHSILFCVQGYQLILYLTDNDSKSVLLDSIFMIIYLIYMLGNSYIYCYVSEILQEESLTIGLSAYKCEWFSLSPKMARNLLFIIQRCRRPVKFTAAKIYEMNMQKFGSILKTSMGYLSLLICFASTFHSEQLAMFHFYLMAAYQFIGVILVQTIKLIIIWGDVDTMSEILTCALLLVLCGLAKIIALWYYRKKLLDVLSTIIQDWNNSKTQEELDILKSHGYLSKKISFIYISMAMSASITRACQLTYMNADFWFKRHLNATHYLSMEAYFPYDTEPSPIFEITFVVDYMAAFFGNLSNCGTDSLFIQIGFHFTAVFRILHLKLMNIATEIKNGKVDFKDKLRQIIEKHEDINRGLGLLQDIFSKMLMVQLMAHSILFCMQGYQLILYLTDENSGTVLFDAIFMVAYLMYMLLNSFIYCYVSEELKNASIKLGESAYSCKWFHLSPQNARNFIIIILRCRKPMELTAAKFYVMNMEKFSSILKTSLGYLSLLLTLKKAL
ncbi:uncharacterized protein LOC127283818 [Leptopilina boulardi]|uniref:uncharacterized protein LOC127283818 n=1 Tax=Leptopilina boulardi TaxID=63433 RepID=UPI0021F6740E|nr:uncharacterized protein LOC127283818 [Leptopilina boulardi]